MVADAAPTQKPGRLIAAVRDAGLAALVMFGLMALIVGVQTVDGEGGLAANFRFDWVLIFSGAVFAGRLAGTLGAGKAMAAVLAKPVAGLVETLSPHVQRIIWLALGFAVAMPFMPFADRYVVDVATAMLIYVMLGWGLNIVVGLAGLLDLGYVAFYAVGAYSYAMLAKTFGLSFWECLPLAGLMAAMFGLLLGFPVLRLRGDYLAIVTLGFGEIIRIVLINWYTVTGGPNGISGIPRPTLFGLPFTASPPEGATSFNEFFGIDFDPNHRIIYLYFVILALALVVNFFTNRARRLPLGRAWEALREDEIACRALGINPTNTKLSAFAVGAMFGGLAGAFFATRQGFISPESFTFFESAVVLAIVVLGGMGSQIGVVIASFVLIVVPELFREFAEFRMLAFGLGMVLIMIWRPRGLIAHREPTIRLHSGQGSGR